MSWYVEPNPWGLEAVEISGDGDDGAGAAYVLLNIPLEELDEFISDLKKARQEIEEVSIDDVPKDLRA